MDPFAEILSDQMIQHGIGGRPVARGDGGRAFRELFIPAAGTKGDDFFDGYVQKVRASHELMMTVRIRVRNKGELRRWDRG